MSLDRRFPSAIRFVSCFLVATLILQACPPSLFASTESRGSVAQTVNMIRQDRDTLAQHGKEAYLDRLFGRMDGDVNRIEDQVKACIDRIGARRLCLLTIGLASPILAGVIAVVPEPWQAWAVTKAIMQFVRKVVKEIKELLATVPAATLKKGLDGLLHLLGDKNFLAGVVPEIPRGETPWWESFFGNNTIVKNFIICVCAVGSIAVGIGLAIAGSTAAPIVAIIGALVSLVALINTDGDDARSADFLLAR